MRRRLDQGTEGRPKTQAGLGLERAIEAGSDAVLFDLSYAPVFLDREELEAVALPALFPDPGLRPCTGHEEVTMSVEVDVGAELD